MLGETPSNMETPVKRSLALNFAQASFGAALLIVVLGWSGWTFEDDERWVRVTIGILSLVLMVIAPGMAIVDTIQGLDSPVHTHCVGEAHGIAALILACGKRGHRVIDAGGATGFGVVTTTEPGDLEDAKKTMVAVIAKCSGRDADSVAQEFAKGRSFNPDEAVQFGLVDRVEAKRRVGSRC